MSLQVQIGLTPLMERGALLLGGEPHVVHCHYYNHFLQTSIEDAESLYPVEEVLVWTAQEIGHSLFRRLFEEKGISDIAARKALVESVYTYCGYGKVSLANISADGGEAIAPYEHYAYTYAATFPPRPKGKRGVSYFSQGYLAGAIEAIYSLPLGSMGSAQVACPTQGDSEVRWHFHRLAKPLPLQLSPSEGIYETGTLSQPEGTNVPMEQVRDAFLRLPLIPDPETGLIEAFGVVLTLLPGNYYALVSERHLHRLIQSVGPEIKSLGMDMLIESGHVCAFNTLGGIMQSAEWDAIVRPYLHSREDYLFAIAAIMPALGWGIALPMQTSATQGQSHLINWYESTALASLPAEERALDHSLFARGLMAGVMALIYEAGIGEQPLSLDGELYKKLFREGRLYEASFLESRLWGAPKDIILVNRLHT